MDLMLVIGDMGNNGEEGFGTVGESRLNDVGGVAKKSCQHKGSFIS